MCANGCGSARFNVEHSLDDGKTFSARASVIPTNVGVKMPVVELTADEIEALYVRSFGRQPMTAP